MKILPRPLFIKIMLIILILFGTVSLFLSIALPRLLDMNSYKKQITELLQKELNRQVNLGTARFSWILGPSFRFDNISIKEHDNTTNFLSARKISFRLRLIPLLNKKIDLREIVIDEPRINLNRNKNGILNIADLMKKDSDGFALQTRGITINNGTLLWHDLTSATSCSLITISGIHLGIEKPIRGKKYSFKLSATLEGKTVGKIETSGTIKLPKTGNFIKESDINVKLRIDHAEYWRLWPYFASFIPFPTAGGNISTDLAIKGRWQDFQAKGTLQLFNPSVNWPKVFHAVVAPEKVELAVDLKWKSDLLDIPDLKLSLDGFSIKGKLAIKDLNTKDPLITASATSDIFEYRKVKSYIPFGIITDDTAEFIENRIRGGIFKLTTGTLNGRFSQLSHFGINNNSSCLYINGTAEQAIVQYGESSPTFKQIKGTLEMKDRDFNLTNMSGIFGTAPFTLNGSIKEYATENIPTLYNFSMNISPHPAEVAWFTEIVGADALSFQGTKTNLKLTGEGSLTAYHLSGEWNLTDATYSYPALVKKPAGMLNNLAFSSIIDKNAIKFSSVSYQLSPLNLSATGKLLYKDDIPKLSFEIETNRFQLSSQLPVLTDWQEYKLNGLVQAHIIGHGIPSSLSTMKFSGKVNLNGFNFTPHHKILPVKDINADIKFNDNSLETSDLTIRYGSTPLKIKGKMANITNPEAELFITSDALNLSDFISIPPDKAPGIKQFSTHLGVRNNLFTIYNISGKLPQSSISASGTIFNRETTDIRLRIASTHLDLDEIIPLLAITAEPASSGKPSTPQFNLKAEIIAAKGQYLKTDFNKMTASLKTENGVLKLQNLKSNFLDGKLTLNGQMNQAVEKTPNWNLSFSLDHAKSCDFLKILGIEREIEGRLTAQGKLRANGNDFKEIKKSLNGNIAFKVERGTLKRFNILSKVISILNVSQLLTFSLPDMANNGMPFNEITSTVRVKDGVMTTEDFFIDSNVMHLTTVGYIDLGNEKLDMLIGVQPLQTVDRVVSRIPVLGWILSGGDGSLITTYFEAKGSWSNPEVTAIPVKGMAVGTLNIFRRVFELPVRLFTDTGEVILGNQKERPKAKPH